MVMAVYQRVGGGPLRGRSATASASPRCTSPACWNGHWPTCAYRSPSRH